MVVSGVAGRYVYRGANSGTDHHQRVYAGVASAMKLMLIVSSVAVACGITGFVVSVLPGMKGKELEFALLIVILICDAFMFSHPKR